MSNVSIIMVSYNTGPALKLALASCFTQAECNEVILVDNGNTPGDRTQLKQLVESHAPRLRILSDHGNIGFAKGCNLGVAAAKGEYILLLNPDCMLPEGGLARAMAALVSYPPQTLAGCYLINPDGSEQRGSRRALLNPKNAGMESLGLHHIFKNAPTLNLHQSAAPEQVQEVPAISGAFMLLSRKFYEELQGLDEGYFVHMEDMDLCYRVHQAGGKVIWIPDIQVLHFGGTSNVASAFIERHKAKGFIRYLSKHFSTQYSPFMLRLMEIGIWVRYALTLIFQVFDTLFVPPLEEKQEIIRLVLLYKLSFYTPAPQDLAGKTFLITGPCGQIGLNLVGKALSRGANVIALYHEIKADFAHPNLRWIQQDLSKDFTLPDDVKADVLINTPALWLLPRLLPALVKATGVKRIIAISSTGIMGKTSSNNTHEKEVVKNLEQAEADIARISTELELESTIFRPTMIYGAGLDNNITRLAYVARRFGILPIYLPAKGFRHPVQAADLAEASLSIVDSKITMGKTYNLGGSESLTYRTMLERIFQFLGKKPHLIHMLMMPQVLDALGFVYQIDSINGEMARRMNVDLLFDISDAVRDFNYSPHGFLAGDVII